MNRFPIIILALITLGAGCSSSSSVPSQTNSEDISAKVVTIDPCSLITKSEAAAYIQKDVKDGARTTSNSFPYTDDCIYGVDWHEGDPIAGVGRMVQIEINQDHPDLKAKDWYFRVKKGMQDSVAQLAGAAKNVPVVNGYAGTVHVPKDIPSLGDDAYDDGVGVRILKGNVMLFVRIGALSPEKADLSVDAAKKAAARLP